MPKIIEQTRKRLAPTLTATPVLPHPTLYIGIDPGTSGGIACLLSSNGRTIVHDTEKAPPTLVDLWEMVSDIIEWTDEEKVDVFAVLEKVGGYTKAGGKQPGSSAFKFGTSFGALQMALIAAEIPFEEITPQRWQKGLGIPPKKSAESKTAWKNRLKAHAQRLFPSEKITLAIADALLIAEFCRRSRQGLL